MPEEESPSPRRRGDAGRGERTMEVEPIRSTRIYEEIVRQIKSMIAEGRLRSGDQLPAERELAEKFLVSRTSVREALRTLESLGLVEIRPGEGTFVREVSVGELFEARRLLEPAIASLAAARATREEIHDMERVLGEQANEVAAGRTGVSQDAQFHAAIGAAAHNRAITRVVNALVDLLTQSREELLSMPGRPERSYQDHRRVLDAVKRHDENEAREAMQDHLVAVEALVAGVRGRAQGASEPPPAAPVDQAS